MDDEQGRRNRFDVLPGGRRLRASVCGIDVVLARDDDPPFHVDATVLEEDTWLALSADTRTVVSPGHPVRVMTQAWEAKPEAPGTVVVATGSPTRLLAVVHDLDREPSWTAQWVEQALTAALHQAIHLGCESLRLPLLGTEHGRLPALEFVELLHRALRAVATASAGPSSLRRIWLVRPAGSGAEIYEALRSS